KGEDDVAAFAQDGYLEIYVTDPVPEDIVIRLETENGTYTAAGEASAPGNPYYEAYGAGSLFSFRNKNAEKICYFLPEDVECMIPMTLTVWGAGSDPSALTLIANGTPHN
ncbi:MAG: hypothetical protein IKN38_04545, partial [Clostridia bacterium]|nr:hypothetical protein [Clostridia bacterium]